MSKLSNEELLTEIQKFKANDVSTPEFMFTYIAQGFGIATNGFCLAWAKLDGEQESTDENNTFVTNSLMPLIKNHQKQVFQPFSFPEIHTTDCKECGGKGFTRPIKRKCEECGGSGEVEFGNTHNNYECECKTCGGAGEFVTKPDSSDGEKEICTAFNCVEGQLFDAVMPFYDGHINPLHLNMLKDYPDLQIAVKKGDSIGIGVDKYYFKSGNGLNIIIMGSRG